MPDHSADDRGGNSAAAARPDGADASVDGVAQEALGSDGDNAALLRCPCGCSKWCQWEVVGSDVLRPVPAS